MILNNIRNYLAGPINFVDDDGVGWREKYTKLLKQVNPTIIVLDPCHKPLGLGSEVGTEKKLAKEWKRLGEWGKITEYAKNYRRIDLRMVDHSHLFTLYVDTDVHMCGSYNELHFAEQTHKPRFAILKNGRSNAPDWLFTQIRYNDMFDSVEECIQRIDDLDKGKLQLDDRWVLGI